MTKIGITEAGDPVFDDSWVSWVRRRNPAILITKNFKKLYEDHPGLLQQSVLIHATVTGYGGSPIEPGVPNPKVILDFLANLPSNEKKLITLRIDPIIPTEECIERSHKIYQIGRKLGLRDIRISIMDCYEHVLKRIETSGFSPTFVHELRQIYRPISGDFKWVPHADFHLRYKVLNNFLPEAKTCCEPGFAATNVPCVGKDDIKLLGIQTDQRIIKKGQREFCGCCSMKHELLSGKVECKHACIYCYWKGKF